jgi:hypothetical protein
MPVPAATTADTGAAVTAAAPATAQASATAELPKVVEAAPADAPDSTTIMAPEQTVPPKKAKRHVQQERCISRNRFDFPASVRVSRQPVVLPEFAVEPRPQKKR